MKNFFTLPLLTLATLATSAYASETLTSGEETKNIEIEKVIDTNKLEASHDSKSKLSAKSKPLKSVEITYQGKYQKKTLFQSSGKSAFQSQRSEIVRCGQPSSKCKVTYPSW